MIWAIATLGVFAIFALIVICTMLTCLFGKDDR